MMKAEIGLSLDFDEWLHTVNELEFLMKKAYGEDLKKQFPEIRMQVPHVLVLMKQMMQFSTEPEEPSVVKLAREEM